jgi:hypothetical protein
MTAGWEEQTAQVPPVRDSRFVRNISCSRVTASSFVVWGTMSQCSRSRPVPPNVIPVRLNDCTFVRESFLRTPSMPFVF